MKKDVEARIQSTRAQKVVYARFLLGITERCRAYVGETSKKEVLEVRFHSEARAAKTTLVMSTRDVERAVMLGHVVCHDCGCVKSPVVTSCDFPLGFCSQCGCHEVTTVERLVSFAHS